MGQLHDNGAKRPQDTCPDNTSTLTDRASKMTNVDTMLTIANVRSRLDKKPVMQEVSWGELVKRLEKTYRTTETSEEYHNMDKEKQSRIKDKGGFIGGKLRNSDRKKASIMNRQLLVLDIDNAPVDFVTDASPLQGKACLIHTTHKHTPDKPRLRLVIPLNRPVLPDEYEPVGRMIASIIGPMEIFDDSTFEINRIMYYPTTSSDGVFWCKSWDGDWVDVDGVLKAYKGDWSDSSLWPVSKNAIKEIRVSADKQENPLTKKGIVGSFCRTYGIREAIDLFLSDLYVEGENGRYSYITGSTSNGLEIYENKFAYSYHSNSDPAFGRELNAFDLVRVHLFEHLDEGINSKTPIHKRPSYIAMCDWCAKDAQVAKTLLEDAASEAKYDFNNYAGEEYDELEIAESNTACRELMSLDSKKRPLESIDNIKIILENYLPLKNAFAYDAFTNCEVATRHLPWRKVTRISRRITDSDECELRRLIDNEFGLKSRLCIADALKIVIHRNIVHPVRDYLNSLRWDGVPRIERLLIDYMGAVDNEINRVFMRKMMIAAVSRIMSPGCKFDNVLVLVGAQGVGKSSFIRILGKGWTSDSFTTFEGKEAVESLQGFWLIEMAEMSAATKQEHEKAKHFLTKNSDNYRAAYAKRTEDIPRQCVFFATTNKLDFLRDPTGNRRYWPVMCNKNLATKNLFTQLEDEVDQLWAEALHYYLDAEDIFLTKELEEQVVNVQKLHTEEHAWYPLIAQFLDEDVTDNWDDLDKDQRADHRREPSLYQGKLVKRQKVCAEEIWRECLGKGWPMDEPSRRTIIDIMINMPGWIEQPNRLRHGMYGQPRRGFLRKDANS